MTKTAADFAAVASKAGWTERADGDWVRSAASYEPANETTPDGARYISVGDAEEACEWDFIVPDAVEATDGSGSITTHENSRDW